ncbi:hypothetical protein Tco_0241661 [Tanacetum coccineum]
MSLATTRRFSPLLRCSAAAPSSHHPAATPSPPPHQQSKPPPSPSSPTPRTTMTTSSPPSSPWQPQCHHYCLNIIAKLPERISKEKTKQSQNNKTGLGMEKTVKDKAKSKPKIGNGTPINFLTPYSSNDSPSFANHPPQPQYVPHSCELCGNDAHHGYDFPPQVPFVYNQDPCSNQNFDYFPQTSPSFPQQYPCCEDCGGPHETFQCQPMNYYEPNLCYDSNYSSFDQTQPPQYTVNHPIFNAQNELLNSQNNIMEQMTSICDMVGQIMQKKEEEKRIAEEQATKDRYWKIPICYDDDEDYTIAITPVLST